MDDVAADRDWDRPCCAVLVEFVKVKPDEQFFELAFVGQVSHDLVKEAGVVSELHRDGVHLLLDRVIPADVDAVTKDHEMELKDEFKDLVESDL